MTASLAIRTRPGPVRLRPIRGVPLVRLRPAPRTEPPYDGEDPRSVELDAAPVEPAELPAQPGRPEAAPLPPEARQCVLRYLSVCLEVLDGFRPVGHLRRLTAPTVFDAVTAQLARPVARAGHPPVTEAGRGAVRVGADRIRVGSVRICEPQSGVIEVVAVLGRGGRAWALAYRLEHTESLRATSAISWPTASSNAGAAWLCTHFQVV